MISKPKNANDIMAKKDKESVRLNRTDDDDSIVSCEEEPEGFFDRLFNPGTIDTDISGESEFDERVDSQTIFTDQSSDEESIETSGSALAMFDKDLRARHRNACKSMTVSMPNSKNSTLFRIVILPFFVMMMQ